MKKGYFGQTDTQWIIPIADKHGKYLKIRKEGVATDKYTGQKKPFSVQQLIWAQQSDDPEKIIVLQEIVWSNQRSELRLGYYTTSRTGHWWWGQFALMIPRKDLEEILAYAKDKRMLHI